MSNEITLFLIILLDLAFVQVIYRWNKSFLYVAIVLNLLLVSIFGGKLITVFGNIINNGNVFYALVFFSIQLIVERFGRREAFKGVWIGSCSIVFFMLMSHFVTLQTGIIETIGLNRALDTLFQTVPRIALASISAFIISQIVNILVFSYMKKKTLGKFVFLRVNLANISGQLVDSLIFFAIAFFGTTSLDSLTQIFITGFILKVLIGLLTTPLFYFRDINNQD